MDEPDGTNRIAVAEITAAAAQTTRQTLQTAASGPFEVSLRVRLIGTAPSSIATFLRLFDSAGNVIYLSIDSDQNLVVSTFVNGAITHHHTHGVTRDFWNDLHLRVNFAGTGWGELYLGTSIIGGRFAFPSSQEAPKVELGALSGTSMSARLDFDDFLIK